MTNTRNWVELSELVASIAVVISLVFLIYEIRQNTVTLEKQIWMDRQSRMVDPYLSSDEIRSAYAKIKSKDGLEHRVDVFVEKYDLDTEEAVAWVRMLDAMWYGYEIDFWTFGKNDALDSVILGMLQNPDQMLYWDAVVRENSLTSEFIEHVEKLRDTK